jgi:hypothetical protein
MIADIRPAIVAHLTADPAVAGIVGDRVVPFEAGLSTPRPQVLYVLLSDEPRRTRSEGPQGVRVALVQVDMLADSLQEAAALAAAVEAAMDWHGGTSSGVTWHAELSEPARDTSEAEADGDDTSVARITQTYRVRYRAAS